MRQSTYMLAMAGIILSLLVPFSLYKMGGTTAPASVPLHQSTPMEVAADLPMAPVIKQVLRPAAYDDTKPNLIAIPWHDPQEMQGLIPPARNKGVAWHIYKTEWSPEDELGYMAFVTAIGRASCFTIDECLRDPANPYRDLDDDFIWLGDCADMVYILRGYYAWKNGLPFSYQNRLRTADGAADDLRYSRAGNIILGRRDVRVPVNGHPINAQIFLNRMRYEVSTAMFRIHPEGKANKSFDDFYPVKLERNKIAPGSVAYDIHGHVGIVYEIEPDGRVLIIAAHPDQTVARSWYGPNFQRSGPELGSGIKAWRPIKLVGATQKADGTWVGGKIVAPPNEQLEAYSLMQYFGTTPNSARDWKTADFVWKGRTLNYFDYVRRVLAEPGRPIDPLSEFREALQSLCADSQARRIAVMLAVRNRIHEKPHPKRLPDNIYGTYGLWESFSTPSRDARLKTSFIDALRVARQMVERTRLNDPEIAYEGENIAQDLLDIYQRETAQCKITYQRMDETYVIMDLSHINDRLFQLSFDPYHCPERRWGAVGEELSTCVETEEKTRWYEAERYLRYQYNRTYDQFTGFRLSELQSPLQAPPDKGGIGAAQPADVDIRLYLQEQARRNQAVLAGEAEAANGG